MLLELPGVGFLDPGQVRGRDTGMEPSIEGLLSRSLHLTLILSTVLRVRHVRQALCLDGRAHMAHLKGARELAPLSSPSEHSAQIRAAPLAQGGTVHRSACVGSDGTDVLSELS